MFSTVSVLIGEAVLRSTGNINVKIVLERKIDLRQTQNKMMVSISRTRTYRPTRPFYTCCRPTQSTIAAFCRHQSPGSAYQQTVDCW